MVISVNQKVTSKMKLLRRNLMVTFRIICLCLIGCLIMVLVMNLFPLEETSCRYSEVLPGGYFYIDLDLNIPLLLST